MRGIVNHGMYKRYYHDEIGVNSRLDSIQAAILRVKLPHLDAYNQSRAEAAQYYSNAFSKIDGLLTPVHAGDSTHVYHQYTLRVLNGKRDELIEFLNKKDIDRKSTRLNSSHVRISYAVFCLKKKKKKKR